MIDLKLKVEVNVSEGGLVREGFGDFNGELSLAELLAFMKQSLILTADSVVREEQDAGFDKHPIVIVDGKTNRAVFDVSPLGSLEFVARASMADILTDTYSSILGKSPVLTGRYKSSNYVFLNGKQVATDLESFTSWINSNPPFLDKDLIRFVNFQPYARKLERYGVTSQKQGMSMRDRTRTSKSTRKGRGTVIRVNQPNGTYYLTARLIRSRYRRNSTIRFEFITGSDLGIAGNFAPRKGKPGRTYLYPSILISVAEGGIV